MGALGSAVTTRDKEPPMSDQALTIEKLTPHIGAEVRGVDLSRPLDEPTFKRVHDAR